MSLTILIIWKRIGVYSFIQLRDFSVLVLKQEKQKEKKNTVFLRFTLNLVRGLQRSQKLFKSCVQLVSMQSKSMLFLKEQKKKDKKYTVILSGTPSGPNVISLTILIIWKRIGVNSFIQFRNISVLVLKEEKKKQKKILYF